MDLTSNGFHHCSGVFQRKLDSIFLDITGVTEIADDMIVYGIIYGR